MWQFWSRLFETQGFDQPWQGGESWTQGLGVTLLLANLATALAYFAIPVLILVYLLPRKHLRWSRLWFLFFVVLAVGGLVHLVSATSFWWPAYRFHVAPVIVLPS
jgi:hypothetical protein